MQVRSTRVIRRRPQLTDSGPPLAVPPDDDGTPRAVYQRLRSQKGYVEDYTVYELDFRSLAVGATASQSIPIQADSAFKWTKACMFASIGAFPGAAFTDATRPVPNATVQVQDTGSGRLLYNAPVPVSSVFGYGNLPFILPVERVFAERSAITVTVTNNSAADIYNLLLSLIGAKVFKYSQ